MKLLNPSSPALTVEKSNSQAAIKTRRFLREEQTTLRLLKRKGFDTSGYTTAVHRNHLFVVLGKHKFTAYRDTISDGAWGSSKEWFPTLFHSLDPDAVGYLTIVNRRTDIL